MSPFLWSFLTIISLFHGFTDASLNLHKLPLPAKTVYQFPEPTWIENFAVRSNGDLILTIISRPEVYLLDPSSPSSKLVYSFPVTNSVLGITEIAPDVFATVTGNFSASTETSQQGSWSVWKLDFNHPEPRVCKLIDIPEVEFPNGLEAIPGKNPGVLIADSFLGAVWKVDVTKKDYELIIQLPEMKAPSSASSNIGINGLHLRNGYLYWTNYEAQVFYRVKVNEYGQVVKGYHAEVVAQPGDFMDDFTFDKSGNAWIATNADDTVIAIGANHEAITVAGSQFQLTVAGSTATHFGRREEDEYILYVTTTGALGAPVNGTVTENGKVVAIDTRGM